MAEQEQPLLTEQVEGERDENAGPEVQGPVLDVDMIISRLLSYKEKPGKQVKSLYLDIYCDILLHSNR